MTCNLRKKKGVGVGWQAVLGGWNDYRVASKVITINDFFFEKMLWLKNVSFHFWGLFFFHWRGGEGIECATNIMYEIRTSTNIIGTCQLNFLGPAGSSRDCVVSKLLLQAHKK